jgi:hypothetical protein
MTLSIDESRAVRRIVRDESVRPPRELIVTLTPTGLDLREKGRRKSFLLPYSHAYAQAVKLGLGLTAALSAPKDAATRVAKPTKNAGRRVSRGLLATEQGK